MSEKRNRRSFLRSAAQTIAGVWLLNNVSIGQTKVSELKLEKAEKPSFVEQNLFTAGENGYHTYRIPSIIETKKNSLLVFCEARRQNATDSGDIDLVYRRSTDHGATWSKQKILWNDADNTCGNPCPVVDRKTGTIHLLLTKNLGVDREAQIVAGTSRGTRTVWHCQSSDDGKSWTQPTEITASVKLESWSWYATGPGAGIQTKTGRLIVPCDHIEKEVNYSHVIFSDDNGKTWQRGGRAPNGATNECEVVELADGNLLLNMRNADRNFKKRAVSISTDQGISWSEIKRDAQLTEPICQASIRRYSLADERGKRRQTNRILFSNPASEKREKMTVRLSTDECRSWTTEKTIYAGAAAYSCLAVAADKTIFCLYERGKDTPYEQVTLAKFNLAWLSEVEAV